MDEPFIGQICLFGFPFAPRGWALCNGQLLSISQNTALFSLIGAAYGGDGQTTFALPNLQSRIPIHQGQGPGLSSYSMGQTGGAESVTLNSNQLPSHTHMLMGSTDGATANTVSGNVLATPNGISSDESTVSVNTYAAANNLTPANPNAIGAAGGNQGHPNLQPYLCVNYCIALQGLFPSRN